MRSALHNLRRLVISLGRKNEGSLFIFFRHSRTIPRDIVRRSIFRPVFQLEDRSEDRNRPSFLPAGAEIVLAFMQVEYVYVFCIRVLSLL